MKSFLQMIPFGTFRILVPNFDMPKPALNEDSRCEMVSRYAEAKQISDSNGTEFSKFCERGTYNPPIIAPQFSELSLTMKIGFRGRQHICASKIYIFWRNRFIYACRISWPKNLSSNKIRHRIRYESGGGFDDNMFICLMGLIHLRWNAC